MFEDKLLMFENRLKKVLRILSKQAKQQKVSCFRLYDRDLPEFPLIIDIYETEVQVTEYSSHHHLTPEEYDLWLDSSVEVIRKVLGKSPEQLHLKERKRNQLLS